MKNFIIMLSLGVFALMNNGCGSKKVTIDSDINSTWTSESKLKADERISFTDAELFIDNFFELFNEVVFDPTFKKKERTAAQKKIIETLSSEKNLTRELTIKILNQELKSLHISHVAAIYPIKTEFILKMSADIPNNNNENAVTGRMINDFGIIKVPTFLVPSITLEQVKKAREITKTAKYIIYDIRNNGGGSGSSVSYLIDSILGPDKVLKYSKTRLGLKLATPFVFDSYFDDKDNFGSDTEIKFETEKNFIEWRTKKDAVKDTRPTFVLINSKCASSADAFAMAIKEHKAATLIGKKTSGAVLGGMLYKLDWKGYTALLPFTQIISPNGILYEGIGIEPDFNLDSCEINDDKCIFELIDLIKNKKIF